MNLEEISRKAVALRCDHVFIRRSFDDEGKETGLTVIFEQLTRPSAAVSITVSEAFPDDSVVIRICDDLQSRLRSHGEPWQVRLIDSGRFSVRGIHAYGPQRPFATSTTRQAASDIVCENCAQCPGPCKSKR